jgi:thymidylate synthase (FAD)
MEKSMKVKLFSQTKAAEEFEEDFENAIELIAYCARVSNPSNQFSNETAERLVRYLIKHKHWSPLEMASATLEIETTRDIARQLLRHRSFYF